MHSFIASLASVYNSGKSSAITFDSSTLGSMYIIAIDLEVGMNVEMNIQNKAT